MDLRRTQETQTVNAVRLREAIKERLGHDRVEWLAGELGVNGSTVLRWVEGPTAISLEHVVAIEDALGLDRGELLRAAGYVDTGEISLEQMISHDRRFTLDQRSALHQIVEGFKAANAGDLTAVVTPLPTAPTKKAARPRPKR